MAEKNKAERLSPSSPSFSEGCTELVNEWQRDMCPFSLTEDKRAAALYLQRVQCKQRSPARGSLKKWRTEITMVWTKS